MTVRAERRLRADGRRRRQGRDDASVSRRARHGAPRGYRGTQARAALGRAAAAGRARPGARQPAARAAARRAARGARPQAAPGDADRAQAHPARGRHHVHLRHPRPGRGAHHERPPRGVQRRPDRADRRARRGVRAARRPSSSPGSSGRPTSSSARLAATARRDRLEPLTLRPEKIRCSDAPATTSRRATQRRRGRPRRRVPRLAHPVPRRGRRRASISIVRRPEPRRTTATPLEPRRAARCASRSHRTRSDQSRSAHEIRTDTSRTQGEQHHENHATADRRASRSADSSPSRVVPTAMRRRRRRRRCAQTSSVRARERVSIIAWAGYIERGETDPAYDWVTQFEDDTGCKVSVKTAAHVRRDGVADDRQQRRVRPRHRLGRRQPAADPRRHGAAGQHRPDPELRHRRRAAARRRRGTPSTASTTACRTSGARTC